MTNFESIITSMSNNAESAGLGSMLGTAISEELEKEPANLETAPESNKSQSAIQSEIVQDDLTVEELLILGKQNLGKGT